MTAACPIPVPAPAPYNVAGTCNFAKLKGTATDADLSAAGIKRRIYTTSQNGVFGPTVDQLVAGQSPYRVALWPQTASIHGGRPDERHGRGLHAELAFLDSAASPAAALADLKMAFMPARHHAAHCTGGPRPRRCRGRGARLGR
jgi:hypothetical protein